MSNQIIAAFGVFLLTLILVICRPRGLNIGLIALGGALVAGLLQLISWGDVIRVTQIVWNATSALVGIMIISAVLDQVGFFRWAALHVARLAKNDGRRLFIFTILLSALVSTFFTNDGTVLILTPIICETVLMLGFDPRATLAFAFATGFVADTVSTPLVISNLVNIMSADYFRIPFSRYALLMLVPSLVSLGVSLIGLNLFYRKDLPGHFQSDNLVAPYTAIRHTNLFHMGLAVVALMLPAFFVSASRHIPVSLLIGLAAAVLLTAGAFYRAFAVGHILRTAPWHVITFSLGMYLVVYALRNAGLVDFTAGLLARAAQNGLTAAVLATGSAAAALSATMNNLPATMVGILTIDAMALPAGWEEALALANVIGSDVGPKLTPIGSLATLIWLHELRKRGLDVDWRYYFKVGFLLTIPVLFATLLTLALVLS